MKAIFWKEWRENLKWALLALAAVGIAEGYALVQLTDPNNQLREYESLCSSLFLLTTTFGSAVTGFGLGLIQIIPELRPDRWAFLIHRPVSRTFLFLGKVVAGLALYALAVVPPFLISTLWVAIPGHIIGPFSPGLMIPGLIDILAGVLYYFAGLLTGLIQPRWRIFKIVPLVAGWAFSLGLAQLSFWSAREAAWLVPWIFALNLLPLPFMAIAAWSSFQTTGVFYTQPWIGRLAFYFICLTPLTFISSSQNLYSLANMLGVQGARQLSYSSYEVTTQGALLATTFSGNGFSRVIQMTDWEGQPVNDPDLRDPYKRQERLLNGYQILLGFHPFEMNPGYRQAQTYIAPLTPNTSRARTLWFFVPSTRMIEGFDTRSKMNIGFLGPNGFSPRNRPVQFPKPLKQNYNPYNQSHVLLFQDCAYWIDVENRTIQRLLDAQDAANTVAGEQLLTSLSPTHLLVGVFAQEKGIRFVASDGALLAFVPYQHDFKNMNITVMVTDDLKRFLVEYAPTYSTEGKEPQGFLDEFNGTGSLVKETVLPPLRPSFAGFPVWFAISTAYIFTSVADQLQNLGFYVTYPLLHPGDAADSFKLTSYFFTEAPHLALITLSGAIYALLALWRLHVACVPPRQRWPWTIAVFFFGLIGFLAFLIVNDWPRRQSCPQCNRFRPADQERCPACDAPWPDPCSNGTEIFEPKSEVSLEAGVRP